MAAHTGDIQNLEHEQAIEKIRELVNHTPICLFTTNLSNTPLSTRPMGTQEVDDNGGLWFLSPRDSDKNLDIEKDSRVQLFYANTGKSEFLSLFGNAYISSEKDKIEELWNPIATAWFDEGKDDPQVTVIKVVPEEAYYWDLKNNKMISMMKIMTAAMAGKTSHEGIKGKLKV